MYEHEIKRIVIRRLHASGQIRCDSLVASEFALFGMARRIDLAIISGSEFIGVEIKSQFDTLRRLQPQLLTYERIFDRVILVAAEKHQPQAGAIAPPTTSLWTLARDGEISECRAPSTKERPQSADLIRLLTLVELRKLLGKPRSDRTMGRRQLSEEAARLPYAQIRAGVDNAFEKRFGATSRVFWSAQAWNDPVAGNVRSLSRFRRHRDRAAAARNDREAFWREWSERASAAL